MFSDDWGRHPSSCQHLIRQLLPTMEVTWVNTIGMRPPRLDLLTARRGLEKAAGWMRKERRATSGEQRENQTQARDSENAPLSTPNSTLATRSSPLASSPHVIDAKMWPWMSHRWDRWLNQKLLCRQLHEAADEAIAITTIPIVTDLIGTLPVSKWVYYCVDDFSVWPGLDGKTLGRMEDEMLPKMDRIIAASETLADRIQSRGHNCEVLTHGVDLEFWQPPAVPRSAPTHQLPPPNGQLPSSYSPTVLFWGVVDRRMNADWLLALADRLEAGTITLVGPQQDPDPRLLHHSSIRLPGPVAFEDLPHLAHSAKVLIMPYDDLPVTRAMQPLKLKEYLATLRPVVAAGLPAVEPWQDCLDMVQTCEEFVTKTIQFLTPEVSSVSPYSERVLERLATESWHAKATRFRELLSCE